MNTAGKYRKIIGKFILLIALLPAIAAAQPTIQSVQPVSAFPGDSVTLSINLQGQLPPSEVRPEIAVIGTIQGTGINRIGSVVTASFTIPANETAGKKDVTVQFPAPPDQQNPLVITKDSASQRLRNTLFGKCLCLFLDTCYVRCVRNASE